MKKIKSRRAQRRTIPIDALLALLKAKRDLYPERVFRPPPISKAPDAYAAAGCRMTIDSIAERVRAYKHAAIDADELDDFGSKVSVRFGFILARVKLSAASCTLGFVITM